MLQKNINNKLFFQIFIAVLITLIFTVFSNNSYALSSQAIINITNSERTANRLGTLSASSALNSSASMKAQDMCDKNYWAHSSPDGLTGWTFMSRAGYPFTSAGENLAKDYDTDSSVVSGWMNSSSHRANMLNPSYSDIGVASLNCNDTLLVVAHYGVTANSVAPVTAPPKVEAPEPAPQVKQATKQSAAPVQKPVEAPVAQKQAPVISEPVIEPVTDVTKQAEVLAVNETNTVSSVKLETAKRDQNKLDELWSYLAISMGFLGSIRLKMTF
ncbi:MAG: CAP domain-containing protein [Candidatus Saccharibacteria bacterium]|nr:CAP domain-containing protein [Candidatus Saccharibacteria bacterium]